MDRAVGYRHVVYGVSIGTQYTELARNRLDYIEKKLDKHNNVAERVYKLELILK